MFDCKHSRKFIFITLCLSILVSIVEVQSEPTKEYELARRRLHRDINEFWWVIKTNLETLIKDDNQDTDKLNHNSIVDGQERHAAMMAILEEISEVDGFKSWRERENKELSNLLQSRILFLQNPENCSTAPKLFCKFNKLCGFGCQFEHMVSCLMLAYGTNRTLVLDDRDWSYNGYKNIALGDVFQQISSSCLIDNLDPISLNNIKKWPGTHEDELVECPQTITGDSALDEFTALPEDLADRIIRINGDPLLWRRSQFVKYLWKPTGSTQMLLELIEKETDRRLPIVGIHVRRTDKLVEEEGSFHNIEEYIKHAEEYFQQLEIMYGQKIVPKQIYVASDDPKVFSECRKKFPEYKFLGDVMSSKSADLSSRYNFESLQYLISDIHMLSQSDFLVCTLTSNVCQLAYEIQQQRFVDGSTRIKSLDVSWISAGFFRRHEVIYPHMAQDEGELNVEVGDVINGITNLWNGYSIGKLANDGNKFGSYPLYKTRETPRTSKLPTYEEAKYFTSANISRNLANNKKFTHTKGNF